MDKNKEKSVRIRSGKKGILRPGHPWIFKSQLLKTDPKIKPGDIVAITDESGKFLGRGYYNPKSEIAVRILTFADEPVDRKLLHKKIAHAFDKRKGLESVTNAYRVVFSEADGLPGLIVDRYDDTAVLQALTAGMDKLKSHIADIIDDVLKPKYIYEKSASPFRKLEDLKDVTGWWGDEGLGLVEIFEGKARYIVDIVGGHKTGFYLDQRKSRLALDGIAKDRKVLDLFCYTGTFSVSAAVYGAKEVRGFDIKEDWLELARKNAQLNGVSGKATFEKGDAFGVLKNFAASGEKFDLIILDPPSFLKSKESVVSASKGYRELNTLAMECISDEGVLATFSCSHNMPNELFAKIVRQSASAASKEITILKRCHQAEDHPIVRAIPETEYLKGYFFRVSSAKK